MSIEILHYAAFTDHSGGGNPAGVVLDARALDTAQMQAIAAEVGYSETAFVCPRGGHDYGIRYFAPQAEIPFCGHATVATSVALAERLGAGILRFHTLVGEVMVETQHDDGRVVATLTTVAPYVETCDDRFANELTEALRLPADAIEPTLPAAIAYAGSREFLIAVRTRAQLAALDYDYDALLQFCRRHDLQGGDVIWRESPTIYHARSPFPVGGVVEDPATGAAAAALGAYLRERQLIAAPATITIHQGVDMGRPSLLTVGIGESGGIRVSGQAVAMRGMNAGTHTTLNVKT